MQDPLYLFQEKYPFDSEQVLAFSHGDRYAALLLRNGQIGVCATLGQTITVDPMSLTTPNLNKADHRILYHTFVNASANYTEKEMPVVDILDNEKFTGHTSLVMVGYFVPLVKKLQQMEVPIQVYDRIKKDPILEPIENLSSALANADVVILSSTSLSNGTFNEVVDPIGPDARVHMLGPSTPMNPLLFSYPGVVSLYGMTFEPFDFELLKMIHEGAGTRSFGIRGKKRYLCLS